MFDKIKNWWSNPDWNEPWWSIRAFFLQPIIWTKSIEFVKACNASFSGEDDKYLYYWVGDFKQGYQVKVRKPV